MNVTALNQFFCVDGPNEMDDGSFIPTRTVAQQQSDWYYKNQERLKKKAVDYLNENRDEINRKRREARATEPYRSEYLRKQRERRARKSGSV